MTRMMLFAMGTIVTAMLFGGCDTAPKSEFDRDMLTQRAAATVKMFKERDPGLAEVIDKAYGYAVFPNVGKGAVGVGGAYGKGVVYQGGQPVGYCDLSQGTVGLQLGGQAYRELILFKNELAFMEFTDGDFALAAQASAVAAEAGASADADYQDGVMVFTMTKGGLMYEASVGGQDFDYVPIQ